MCNACYAICIYRNKTTQIWLILWVAITTLISILLLCHGFWFKIFITNNATIDALTRVNQGLRFIYFFFSHFISCFRYRFWRWERNFSQIWKTFCILLRWLLEFITFGWLWLHAYETNPILSQPSTPCLYWFSNSLKCKWSEADRFATFC